MMYVLLGWWFRESGVLSGSDVSATADAVPEEGWGSLKPEQVGLVMMGFRGVRGGVLQGARVVPGWKLRRLAPADEVRPQAEPLRRHVPASVPDGPGARAGAPGERLDEEERGQDKGRPEAGEEGQGGDGIMTDEEVLATYARIVGLRMERSPGCDDYEVGDVSLWEEGGTWRVGAGWEGDVVQFDEDAGGGPHESFEAGLQAAVRAHFELRVRQASDEAWQEHLREPEQVGEVHDS